MYLNITTEICPENKKFVNGELIRSGTFGKVYKYKISNTNREIVIKQTESNCAVKNNIEENIDKISSQRPHENIVRYFGALEIFGKHCTFMEYLPGGSLKDLIKKSGWIEHLKVIKFSKQILNGLQFIHSQGIIHRDIKPANMLLDYNETLKLSDFGISISLENAKKSNKICGTLNYRAPEIYLGKKFDFSADIWSTGASIIHMITGNAPYHLLTVDELKQIIVTTKKIEFTPCQPISETMQSFIDDLLTQEQSKRPTAEYLLKHLIFNKWKNFFNNLWEFYLE